MSTKVPKRQDAVNRDTRPRRTPAGEAFTTLVVQVAALGGRLTEIGEELARHGGLTLARWVVLDAVAAEPATVAQIGRMRGLARQSVQRTADLVVEEGFATYIDNPAHRRAKLLTLSERGRESVRVITVRQKRWADAVGAEVGLAELERAQALIERVTMDVAMHDVSPPG
ncbi:MAG: MarR family winged helix-turn-helix transcriptional regulator [Acidimicrobiia bacterium]